jgi:hypothetical protein
MSRRTILSDKNGKRSLVEKIRWVQIFDRDCDIDMPLRLVDSSVERSRVRVLKPFQVRNKEAVL